MRRVNAGQLADIAQRSWALDCTPRFIELMPIGGLKSQSRSERYTYNEILTELSATFALERLTQCTKTAGPAQYWRVKTGPHRNRLLGTISPMSDVHFCETCNRARLTAVVFARVWRMMKRYHFCMQYAQASPITNYLNGSSRA